MLRRWKVKQLDSEHDWEATPFVLSTLLQILFLILAGVRYRQGKTIENLHTVSVPMPSRCGVLLILFFVMDGEFARGFLR